MDFTPLKTFLDEMAAKHTPGNAVVVYKDGQIVCRYAAGYADLENRIPYSPSQHIYIYSCTKVATVTAAAQLLERGLLHLSDPLSAYIPVFQEMYVGTPSGGLEKARSPITVENLFTMTAGFTYNLYSPGFKAARESTLGHMETVAAIRFAAKDHLSFHPGEKWQYSICHDVLAALVCVVSGKPFRDYMQENIFSPLEMNETGFHLTREAEENMAVQYCFVQDQGGNSDLVEAQRSGKESKGTFQRQDGNHFILGPEYDSGGAGIITTTDDYAKLMAALANYGLGLTNQRILRPETVDLLRTDRLSPRQRDYFNWEQHTGYGYGLGVRTHIDQSKSNGLSSIGEFGWGGAAGATVIIDPKEKLGVFYSQHCLNPRETFYQPRLRDALYASL